MESRSALVLYGSETGNAQEGAAELGRILARLRFNVRTCAFNDIDVETMTNYELCLCSIATTGQGELPANSRLFWKKLLRKKLPTNYLVRPVFAIFGFGDSSYPKYNWAALKLRRRLVQLGGQELLSMGQGDQQHAEGHDSAFIPWANEVRMHVMQHFPLGKGLEPIPGDVLLEPQWLLSLSEEKHEKVDSRQKDKVRASDDTPNGTAVSKALSGDSQYVELCLESNERLTPKTHWQDVRKLTFLTSARVEYLPGDVLTIFPRNATEDVDHIIQLMNWHDVADRSIEFRSNPKCSVTTNSLPPNSIYLPIESITLRRVLTELVDLNAIPGRHFFGQLAHFTQYEAQRDRLSEFSNPEYLDELYDYTTRPRRSVLEVLQEFNTVKLPWQWVAEILPALRGRQFSIASGGKLKAGENDSTRFELLVAIVKYRTVIRKLRRGVCTRYLEGLQAGDSLRALLQKGGLNITRNDLRRPILMVGPGTGVAPIRSLIWQRLAWNNEIMEQQGRITGSSELSQGDNVLFFGCRNRHADYFFKHEWTELQKHFSLRVFAAFSRDQGKTQYVQDLIRQHSRVVHNLIYEQHGTVFVCGSSGKMPQAVREALVAVLEKEALLDQEAAEIYIKLMEKEDRYKQETW